MIAIYNEESIGEDSWEEHKYPLFPSKIFL